VNLTVSICNSFVHHDHHEYYKLGKLIKGRIPRSLIFIYVDVQNSTDSGGALLSMSSHALGI
jgi:hypothetical protein